LEAPKLEALNTNTFFARQKVVGKQQQNEFGSSVLYVMSRDQRIADNHALIAAQKHAVSLGLPLAVVFVCNTTTAPRALEHYEFMLQGLLQVEKQLQKYNIAFIGLVGEHEPRLSATFHHLKPAAIYADFNPLKGPQSVIGKLALEHPITVVDTHNVVPVWIASEKQEYAARTLRPKIHKHAYDFLIEPEKLIVHPYAWPNKSLIPFTDVIDIFGDRLAKVTKNNTSITYKPGETAAEQALALFLNERFGGYAVARNDPAKNCLSNMSPYLHFGQISSLRIMLEAQKKLRQNSSLQADYDALLEELVVRKELSDNYCYYNKKYDSLQGVAEWALNTLAKHSADPREFVYTKEQFENALTHDVAWNAAQKQLRNTGKMHGYMRMYWAKKVLEWSESPEEAIQTLIYLNDFYSIDGGDPNGYVGILWSIAGLHDRPWGERAVYGTIRSMVYSGLQKKFDINTYIEQNS
jgi:deoxyribodipyrimidine photo-lyase